MNIGVKGVFKIFDFDFDFIVSLVVILYEEYL